MARRQDAVAALGAARAAAQNEDEPRDRPLDPWRRPGSEKVAALVRWVISIFEQREQLRCPRQRRRRPADQVVMEQTVAALICDAIHRELTVPGGRLMLPLSNQKLGTRSRYRAPVFSKQLPHIVELLDGDVLDQRKGHLGYFGRAKQTTIALAGRFKAMVVAQGIGLADIRREPDGELLILKRAREDHWDTGAAIEYDDTPTTEAFRAELVRLNARLASLDLGFDPEHPRASRVDLRERTLRRIFNNGRFDHGGRLWGGFWQELSKKDRADAMRIDGDVVVTLDYRQMGPRLLYARANAKPPADCYAVPGHERFRSGWKKLLNALLFGGTELKRLPKGTADLLPVRIGVDRATRLLLEHNAPIADLITEDIGFELMFKESEVLIEALFELERQEIAALPIHDAVIVPEYLKEPAIDVMVDAFRRQTGQPGEVSVELNR